MTVPPLELGQRLGQRLAVAIGAPLVTALGLALTVALVGDAASVPLVTLLCASSMVVTVMPLTVAVTVWMPVVERVAIDGETLVATWSSWRRHTLRVPLQELVAVEVVGGGLRLVQRRGPAVTLRLPLGRRSEARGWARALRLPAAKAELQVPSVLDRAIAETTHDGVRFELRPVYTPPPRLAVAAVVAPSALITLGVGFALLGGGADVQVVSCTAVTLAVIVAGAAALLAPVARTDLALRGRRLEVDVHRMLGRERWSELLSDIVVVMYVDRALELRLRSGDLRVVPLPDRSPAQAEALVQFLNGAVQAGEVAPGGEVPEALRALLGHAERKVAEGPR